MEREGTISVGGVIHVWELEDRGVAGGVPSYVVIVNGRRIGRVRDHRAWSPGSDGWYGEWSGDESTFGPHKALESILRRIIAVDRGYAFRVADELAAYADDQLGRSFVVFIDGTDQRVARIMLGEDRWDGHMLKTRSEIGSAGDLRDAMMKIATDLGLELDSPA